MKAVAWVAVALTTLVAGVYTVVSLARWQWNRALFFALVFVAAELLVCTGVVLVRLGRLQQEVDAGRSSRDASALHALRATRHEQRRFAWLRVDPHDSFTRMNVFITLVVGGGVLLSAGAWLVDKVASNTVDPKREARLSQQLAAIAYEPGLVVDDVTALARTRLDRTDRGLEAFLEPEG
ncbi:MAG: hypothetical protein KF703_06495 [Actinobacteria bacterium]|nr:hypothetical protein [Actinomycetota bacterium]